MLKQSKDAIMLIKRTRTHLWSELRSTCSQDFPLFLPSLRHFVESHRGFLECLDLLESSTNLSLPDGDVFLPVWGLTLLLLIKAPSSPFIFTVVDSLLRRCWALLQLPEISALLSLLSIGILIFAEPERLHVSCWRICGSCVRRQIPTGVELQF